MINVRTRPLPLESMKIPLPWTEPEPATPAVPIVLFWIVASTCADCGSTTLPVVPTAIAPMHEFWMLLLVSVASVLELPPWVIVMPPPRMLRAHVGPPPAAAGDVIVALLTVTLLSVVLAASEPC